MSKNCFQQVIYSLVNTDGINNKRTFQDVILMLKDVISYKKNSNKYIIKIYDTTSEVSEDWFDPFLYLLVMEDNIIKLSVRELLKLNSSLFDESIIMNKKVEQDNKI